MAIQQIRCHRLSGGRDVLRVIRRVACKIEIPGEVAVVEIVHIPEIPAELQQVIPLYSADVPSRLHVSSGNGYPCWLTPNSPPTLYCGNSGMPFTEARLEPIGAMYAAVAQGRPARYR